MSYNATVFNVMIASPGDLKEERDIIRQTIQLWNIINSESKGIVLMPLSWETHASPEMGSSAQDIINVQVLEKCDFLVGVFWTRIGTPTKQHASGSVEEVARHINAEKPAMLYFSSRPANLGNVDLEQYKKLQEFKDYSIKHGLCETYSTIEEFKEKFYRQLQLKINTHQIFNKNQNKVSSSKNDTNLPLNSESQLLLQEAALDEKGTILRIDHMGGTDIKTNGKTINSSYSPREIAKWEAAIRQLQTLGFIRDANFKREVFYVTDLGYRFVESIKN